MEAISGEFTRKHRGRCLVGEVVGDKIYHVDLKVLLTAVIPP